MPPMAVSGPVRPVIVQLYHTMALCVHYLYLNVSEPFYGKIKWD